MLMKLLDDEKCAIAIFASDLDPLCSISLITADCTDRGMKHADKPKDLTKAGVD